MKNTGKTKAKLLAELNAVNDLLLAERSAHQKAEETLRENELRYRRVSSVTSDVVYSCYTDENGDFSIDWLSGAVEPITGYTEDELIARKCWGFLVFDVDFPIFEQNVIGLHPASSGHCELRIHHKNGSVRWIESSTECVTDPSAPFVHRLYGRLTDITERKQSEFALRESEDKFKYLFDNSVIGKSVTQLSGVVQVNKAFLDMLGYSHEEFQNRNWREITHPDDIELTQKKIDSLISGEKDSERFVKRFIHKDGSVIWVDLSSAIRRDKEGKPLYLISSLVNITKRIQAEEKLRESEERLRQVIKQMPYPVEICDPTGTAVMVNNAFLDMFGIPSDDLVVGKYNVFTDPFTMNVLGLESQIKRVYAGETVYVPEVSIPLDEFKSAYGLPVKGVVIHEITMFPVFKENKEIWRAVTIWKDITARKLAEAHEQRRHAGLEKVLQLGKNIASMTNLQDCLLEIQRSIQHELGFEHVEIFLYDESSRNTSNAFDAEGLSQTSNVELEENARNIAMQSPNGIYLNTKCCSPDCNGQELVVSAWAGQKPVAFFRMDTCLSQNPFEPEHIEALQLFAGYAGLAIENARRNEDLKQRIAELNSINRVSQVLVAEPKLVPLIQAVGDQIRIMFNVSVVYISILNPETNYIDFYYQYENKQFFQGTRIKYGEGMTSRVMKMRKSVLINSNWVQEAVKYDVILDPAISSRCSLTVPLLLGDQAIGTISLQDTERENVFTDDHVRQVTTIAANLAVAIDNARVHAALQNELVERRLAEENVKKLNARLEQRVAERTAELESSNRELESLSYNIAHDMRSPVRAIVGYSRLIQLRNADKPELEAMSEVERILAASKRLGMLIDDFLAYLRLGQTPIHIRGIDTASLVRGMAAAVKNEIPAGREVEFIIGELPDCDADLDLLKQVWRQLLSNAVKFTRQCEHARIEIGSCKNGGKLCYFVRDNGIGFDMKYADKIFGVFQHLNQLDEYEGTGIGLAATQRIIHRHGGRIWAESEVDKGATFYFTLGNT